MTAGRGSTSYTPREERCTFTRTDKDFHSFLGRSGHEGARMLLQLAAVAGADKHDASDEGTAFVQTV